MSDIGNRIFTLRKSLGLTLEEVGQAVGVGRSTVRKWENGMIANMRRDKIAKLASALHTTPAFLMGWNTDEDSVTVLLSSSERELLAAYRAASDDDRMIVDTVLKKYTAPKLRAVAAHGGGLTSAPADAIDTLAEQAIPTKDDL